MKAADNQAAVESAFGDATHPQKTSKRSKRGAASPVTLRLTPEERARLEGLAAGMTLSSYIRACLFGREDKRRQRRPQQVVADKQPLAEALGLLGQSRIANNLNQLAYQANIGALKMDELAYAQIDEAYQMVYQIRSLLLKTLNAGA